ncbi:TIM barrel protein [Candidatus Bathyarchaeota archaeon]|nr:TIM barrel protein [Candidatus Bathyarchaeota archaeon]
MASTAKEAADIVVKTGFKYFSLPVTTPPVKIDPEIVTKKDITDLKSIFRSSGVKISSLGMAWPKSINMFTRSTTEWKRNLNYATKLFDYSAALGVKVVCGPNQRSIPLDMDYFEGLKIYVRFWKEAIKHAEELGIIAAPDVVPLPGFVPISASNTAKQLIDMVKAVDSPSFKITFETNIHAPNELDMCDAIRAMGDMIKLVHLADVPGSGGRFNPLIDWTEPLSLYGLRPGTGKIDFRAVFKTLKSIGYDGELSMEWLPHGVPFNPGDDYVSELISGRKFLEAELKRA